MTSTESLMFSLRLAALYDQQEQKQLTISSVMYLSVALLCIYFAVFYYNTRNRALL